MLGFYHLSLKNQNQYICFILHDFRKYDIWKSGQNYLDKWKACVFSEL